MAKNLPKVLIVGGGAGGLELVTTLGSSLGKKNKRIAKVYLADGSHTHIWKPLLHEVATGVLNVGEDEVNYFTHASQYGYRYHFGDMKNLDRDRKVIMCDTVEDLEGNIVSPPREIPYNILVLAVGGKTNSFGTPGVEQHCFTLDSTKEAERLRKRFLGHCFAVSFGNFPKIRMGIVGAGPTGIELASEMHHTISEIRAYGGAIKEDQLEITILEAAPKVLPMSTPSISETAHKELTSKGINIKTNCPIKEINERGFLLGDGSFLEKDIKIWTAGVKAHDWLSKIGLEVDRINRIKVNEYLQTSDPSIFAIGDCAYCPDPNDPSRPLPPTAQCAHQQAEWLAKKIKNDLKKKSTKPFTYKSEGMLVSLGSDSAVGTLTSPMTSADYHLDGATAKWVYSSLYRRHQAAVYGKFKTACIWVGDALRKKTLPSVKLH